VGGGCGEDKARDRNRAALDAIGLVPRYGRGAFAVETEAVLFGRRYAAPIGMAPMGMGGLFWPRMEFLLAAAAQAARIPYVLATPAAAAIEEIAPLAPDVFWFQAYGAPADDYRLTFDMLRRARDAGAHGLMVTIDSPVRAKRPQDARNRLSVPFRPRLGTIAEIARHPAWLRAVLAHGTPATRNFAAYVGKPHPRPAEISAMSSRVMRGGFAWEVVARLRDAWKAPFVVKGILHPADAEIAAKLGADGLLVSNHGGRTFDGAPPAIRQLEAVKKAAPGLTLLLDSGVRSGLDMARGLALGADFILAGRPFQWAVGAAGAAGARYVTELFQEELRQAMGQVGARNLAELKEQEVVLF
jgi:L-lactate dehydrogenase (cytochrome)